MSSKKTRTNLRKNGARTVFISAWNVAGAFIRPNGMTNEVAPVSAERRLVDVIGVHADLMVPRTKVQLGEEVRAVELVE